MLSNSEVNDGAEETLEVAEASLSELQDAKSKVSAQLLLDLRQETEPEIFAEVSIVLAAGNANTAKVMAYQATLTGAEQRSKKMESGSGQR